MRVRQGWQHWDRLLWIAGCSKAEDLKDYVLQPERWVVERRQAVISMSDQIPVWLMPAGDRKLVSQSHIRRCGKARKLRASRAQIASGQVQTEEQQGHAEKQPRQLICNAGTPGNAKARFTLVARQLVEHYFDEQCLPQGSANQCRLLACVKKKASVRQAFHVKLETEKQTYPIALGLPCHFLYFWEGAVSQATRLSLVASFLPRLTG